MHLTLLVALEVDIYLHGVLEHSCFRFVLLRSPQISLTANFGASSGFSGQIAIGTTMQELMVRLSFLRFMQLTEWIIGFFEGEGSFHSGRGRNSRLYLRFTVTQKEYDLLVRIRDYFGLGGISYTDQPTGRVWKWAVCNRHDLKLIIAFLKERIRSKKKRQEFERWKHLFAS